MKASHEQTEKLIGAAQDTAEIAKRTLSIGQRPWVYPELLTAGRGLVYENDGTILIDAKLILRNVGNSPALNVNYFTVGAAGLVPMALKGLSKIVPDQRPDVEADLKEFCERSATNSTALGDAIFPDRDSQRAVTVPGGSECSWHRNSSAHSCVPDLPLRC